MGQVGNRRSSSCSGWHHGEVLRLSAHSRHAVGCLRASWYSIVALQLIAEALRVEGAAWNSEDLRDLVPLEKVDDSGFPYVLTVGEVGKGEQGDE